MGGAEIISQAEQNFGCQAAGNESAQIGFQSCKYTLFQLSRVTPNK